MRGNAAPSLRSIAQCERYSAVNASAAAWSSGSSPRGARGRSQPSQLAGSWSFTGSGGVMRRDSIGPTAYGAQPSRAPSSASLGSSSGGGRPRGGAPT